MKTHPIFLVPIIMICMISSCSAKRKITENNKTLVKAVEQKKAPVLDTAIVHVEYLSYEFPEDTLPVRRVKTVFDDIRFPQFEWSEAKWSGEPAFLYICKTNAIYPMFIAEIGIAGTVIVRFEVDEYGNVDSISLHKGMHELNCEKSAVRAVEKSKEFGKWTPAIRDGKAVRTVAYVPFAFITIFKLNKPTLEPPAATSLVM